MRRTLLLLTTMGSLLAMGAFSPTIPAGAAATATIAVPVATGLASPAAFTFADDGRIFYGELDTGEIRILDPDTGSDTLFFDVPNLLSDGERGLLGLALHPNYPSTRYLYAYVTRSIGGTPTNQIIRLTDQGGTGTGMKIIFTSDTVSATTHNGGRILFGPDGKLYVVIGEATNPANSQNLNVDAGKILRMNPNGGVPSDNPFPGSRVWAYGIRNGIGLAFDPLNGRLWDIQNGPTCNDEVNRITAGSNYGWGPSWTCSTPPAAPANTNRDGPSPDLPEWWIGPTIGPTGGVFCLNCGLTTGNVKLFFGAVNDGKIRRATMTSTRMGILSVTVIYDHPSQVLGLERGPDDALYFSTFSGIYRLAEG